MAQKVACTYLAVCQERNYFILCYLCMPVHALIAFKFVYHARRLCVIKPTVCDVLADRCSCI